MEGDLTLMKMVDVHKRLTLVILARDVTWHLEGKTSYLVEVVAALSVEHRRLENIAGAVVATMDRSGAV